MPSLLAMKLYDSDALLRAYKISEAAASKQDKVLQRITVTLHSPIAENGLQTVVPPIVLGLCDKTFHGVNNWPVMPWFAPYIVHYLFGRKQWRRWSFFFSRKLTARDDLVQLFYQSNEHGQVLQTGIT